MKLVGKRTIIFIALRAIFEFLQSAGIVPEDFDREEVLTILVPLIEYVLNALIGVFAAMKVNRLVKSNGD